jgi:hypothetical protein
LSEIYPLKWTFDLEVSHASIQGFLDSYVPRAIDFIIIEEAEDHGQSSYCWSSPHLNELTDLSQIVLRAGALKALYDGAMLVHTRGRHIIRPSHGPIELHARGALSFVHPSEPFCSDWQQWRYKPDENPVDHFVSASLFQARYDETIRSILILLGNQNADWISLYSTLDSLKHVGWDEKKLARDIGRSAKEFELFMRTANNSSALGPAARHGQKGWVPPDNPMSLTDAQALIFECIRCVIKVSGSEIDSRFRQVLR